MNSLKIDETKAFKDLNAISQQMIMKRVNRLQVEEQIIIARNIGIEQWLKQNPLQERWQQIVIEIVDKSKGNPQQATTTQSQQ